MTYYSDQHEYLLIDKKHLSKCCKAVIWNHVEHDEVDFSVCARCEEIDPELIKRKRNKNE